MTFQVVERKKITYRQYLVDKFVNCLYLYKDSGGIRTYAEFCQKYTHRQSIYKPILVIAEEHLSSDLKDELIELLEESPILYHELITDGVISLYEICNKTTFNRLIERQYAGWKIV